MRVTGGGVVHAADVAAERTAGVALVRTLMTTGSAGPCLVRRLVDVPSGAHFDGTGAAAGELWFVIAGPGQLDIDGHPGLRAAHDRALWIPAGARYLLRADGPDALQLDAVTLPAWPAGSGRPADLASAGSAAPVAADLGDCPVERTGDREFRVLFGPGRGCAVATQFVGEIPPGRAPEHSHPYDEVVLVLEGDGVLHADGDDHALSAGTCAHLAPGQVHCLENTGTGPMRVLGVFHPADSPAAKTARA